MPLHPPTYHLSDNLELLADLAFDALTNTKQYWTGNRVVQIQSRVPHPRRRLVMDGEGKVCTVNKIIAHCLAKGGVGWLKRFFGGDVPDTIKPYVNDSVSLTHYALLYSLVDLIVALPLEVLCVNLKSGV